MCSHFNFQETKKDETIPDAAANKKADSDSDDEEQEAQQKEKGGVSNKKKKVLLHSTIFNITPVLVHDDNDDFVLLFLFCLFLGILRLKDCIFQLQRRMKIAELKQICSRPDVVEVRVDGEGLFLL